uniref:Uncharacterized protein n=1 Tax=Micrurus lemniscatus lemniscatus TaxID=129467 RepID=A0A2D4JF93_MICLE
MQRRTIPFASNHTWPIKNILYSNILYTKSSISAKDLHPHGFRGQPCWSFHRIFILVIKSELNNTFSSPTDLAINPSLSPSIFGPEFRAKYLEVIESHDVIMFQFLEREKRGGSGLPLLIQETNTAVCSLQSHFPFPSQFTFNILISFPKRVWDFAKFFLLMHLMATSTSGF